MRCKILTLLSAVMLLSACAAQTRQTPSSPQENYVEGGLLLPGGAPLAEESFIRELADVQFILVGEIHNSYCDHTAQARILETLARSDIKPVLGLEMVSRDKQAALDSFNDGKLSLEDLPGALGWKSGFDLYRPVFEIARAYNVPVYALNLPREIVRSARINGLDGLENPKYQEWLPKHLILPMPAQQKVLADFYANAKTGMLKQKKNNPKQNKVAFDRFILAQSLWDCSMAENAVAVHEMTKRPVMVLAGTMHVDYGWGIAYRIASVDMFLRSKLVSPWRTRPVTDGKAENASTLPPKGKADFFYYCPPSMKSRLGMTLANSQDDYGDVVVENVVPGSPAEKSGLKKGDVIYEAGGRSISTPYDLHLASMAEKNGDTLELKITREGAKRALKLELPQRAETVKNK